MGVGEARLQQVGAQALDERLTVGRIRADDLDHGRLVEVEDFATRIGVRADQRVRDVRRQRLDVRLAAVRQARGERLQAAQEGL